MEPQQPKELFEFMISYRESFGMNVIPLVPNAGKEVIKAIKNNHVVACYATVTLRAQGLTFFDEETSIPAGPAMLSIRTGSKIIPVAVYQRSEFTTPLLVPLNSERQGNLREDVARSHKT